MTPLWEIGSTTDVQLWGNVLELNNTNAFTPDADYEPATKKYVDDNAWASSSFIAVWSITLKDKIDFHTTEQLERTSLFKPTLVKTVAGWSTEYIWFAKDNYVDWDVVLLMTVEEYYADLFTWVNADKALLTTEWDLVITNWQTVNIDISVQHLFDSIDIQSGWILNPTWTWDLAWIYCIGDCTINWEIDFSSFQTNKASLNSDFNWYTWTTRYSWSWWNGWNWWNVTSYEWVWGSWANWYWWGWGWAWFNNQQAEHWWNWWYPWWTVSWWISCGWSVYSSYKGYGWLAYWNDWYGTYWGWGWAWWELWSTWINLLLFVNWDTLWSWTIKTNWTNWWTWWDSSQSASIGWGWWGWWGWIWGDIMLTSSTAWYSYVSGWWTGWSWWASSANVWTAGWSWSNWSVIVLMDNTITDDTYNW